MEPLAEQTETKDISAIQQQKLLTYEEAMEVIKDATGVSGVQDVVTRFLTQGKSVLYKYRAVNQIEYLI